MIYFELFWSFLKIGLFSFGGGYAAIPLIQDIIVDTNGWLTIAEFTDLITISQMTPGPISVNSATFVGLNIAGFWGAFFATLGNLTPSFVVVTFIAWLYMRYKTINTLQDVLQVLQPAVIAMIAAAGVSLIITAFLGPRSNHSIRYEYYCCRYFYLFLGLNREIWCSTNHSHGYCWDSQCSLGSTDPIILNL